MKVHTVSAATWIFLQTKNIMSFPLIFSHIAMYYFVIIHVCFYMYSCLVFLRRGFCFSWQCILLSIQIFFIGISGIRHRGVSGKRQRFPKGTQSLEESPHRYHRDKGKALQIFACIKLTTLTSHHFTYLSLPRFVSISS